MLLILAALVGPDSLYSRAESLLANHQLQEARQVAEELVRTRPNDERAHLLLGRVFLVWPVTGRNEAIHEFEVAKRLAPDDPEPSYLEASAGLALHTIDGDAMAGRSLVDVLRLDPSYRDTWKRFSRVFQGPDIWRQAEMALSIHSGESTARIHMAELALLLNEPRRADSLAAPIASRAPLAALPFLIRAEASFQAGNDATGEAWYDSAETHADNDSSESMWNAVWMIASANEVTRYSATPPRDRPTFFRSFWGKRDPNLVTSANERIPEHFKRLFAAQKMFRLTQPNSFYYYSADRRAMSASYMRQFIANMVSKGCLGEDTLTDGTFLSGASPDAWLDAAGLSPDQLSVDSLGGSTAMAGSGLDARGLAWVRYGPPDERAAGIPDLSRPCATQESSSLDVEGWQYKGSNGPLTIAFVRGTTLYAGPQGSVRPNGDFLFMPITAHEVASAKEIMSSDRTTVAANLRAQGWSAFFRGDVLGTTDVYLRTRPDTSASVLWDTTGAEVARAKGPGPMELEVVPGVYDLGMDVDSSGSIGRIRQRVTIPWYYGQALSVSSMAAQPGKFAGQGREAVLERMPGDLKFTPGALTTYAEIYGLQKDGTGKTRYAVRYSFKPLRGLLNRVIEGTGSVEFAFNREGVFGDVQPEQLEIEPGRLSPGRYRVALEVTDLVSTKQVQSVSIDIVIQ